MAPFFSKIQGRNSSLWDHFIAPETASAAEQMVRHRSQRRLFDHILGLKRMTEGTHQGSPRGLNVARKMCFGMFFDESSIHIEGHVLMQFLNNYEHVRFWTSKLSKTEQQKRHLSNGQPFKHFEHRPNTSGLEWLQRAHLDWLPIPKNKSVFGIDVTKKNGKKHTHTDIYIYIWTNFYLLFLAQTSEPTSIHKFLCRGASQVLLWVARPHGVHPIASRQHHFWHFFGGSLGQEQLTLFFIQKCLQLNHCYCTSSCSGHNKTIVTSSLKNVCWFPASWCSTMLNMVGVVAHLVGLCWRMLKKKVPCLMFELRISCRAFQHIYIYIFLYSNYRHCMFV